MAVIVWPRNILERAGWQEEAITRRARYANALFSEASVSKAAYAAQVGVVTRALSDNSSVRGLDQGDAVVKEGSRSTDTTRSAPTKSGARDDTTKSDTRDGSSRDDRYAPTSERVDPNAKKIDLPY